MATTSRTFSLTLAATLAAGLIAPPADACTRVVYNGPNDTVITGRSMDFAMDIPANLWVFPRGMSRDGAVGPEPMRWTSRYGSVIASSWDIATSDGMNEKGLVANLLWLVSSEYPPFEPGGDTPGLSVSVWAQYALDNFATVGEAVEAFRREDFVVVTDVIPGTDRTTTVHLSLSDASGDNAIFEYVEGKLVIHHDRRHRVMTNDPVFEQQLAIARYWDRIPGQDFLPGTNHSSDRFVRARYYIDRVTQSDDPRIAAAAVFSVVRNVSVPYGIAIPGFPNLSTTRWRVVADQKNLRYYFETVTTPNTFWVDLAKLDFTEGAAVRRLRADADQTYSGETSARFETARPFVFQGV
jgi:choloylglycine hydrolase